LSQQLDTSTLLHRRFEKLDSRLVRKLDKLLVKRQLKRLLKRPLRSPQSRRRPQHLKAQERAQVGCQHSCLPSVPTNPVATTLPTTLLGVRAMGVEELFNFTLATPTTGLNVTVLVNGQGHHLRIGHLTFRTSWHLGSFTPRTLMETHGADGPGTANYKFGVLTSMPAGHLYAETEVIRPSGSRYCRICHRANKLASYYRRKVEV
jgi:hypothetical protein